MDCTMGSKQRESLVRVAVAYAQAMAERLYEGMIDRGAALEGMEKAVLAELHGFGNEMLSALVGVWRRCSAVYPIRVRQRDAKAGQR